MKNKIEHHDEFIFASCKDWNGQFFVDASREIGGYWRWVSSPTELLNALKEKTPRYIFFFHWSWLVPKTIWKKYECVCFHMTDVPYGRGGSPLQNLILAGHASTKLSALRMVEEMDAGPVYAKRTLDLSGSAQEIYIRAGRLSAEIMKWMVSVRPDPIPQEGNVTVFTRRKPEQSKISKQGDVNSLYDFIRMLDADGYPRAFLDYGDYRFKFRQAKKNGDYKVYAEVEITSTGNQRKENNDQNWE